MNVFSTYIFGPCVYWDIGYFAITAANETNIVWFENGEEKITDLNPDIALLVLFGKNIVKLERPYSESIFSKVLGKILPKQ